MKKTLSLSALAFIAIFCISCATQASSAGMGSAEGYNGPIEVAVKVKDGKIIDAAIISIKDTDSIGVPAAKLLAAEAVEKGSAENLDIVSGATISSKATIQALKQAVAAAH